MKFSKRISALLIILSLIAVLTVTLSLTSCGEEFKIKNGVLKSYNGNSKVVNIPNEVTEIGPDAFLADSFIEEIVFPPSVNVIDPACFSYCPNATWTVSANHPTFYLDNGNLMRRQDKRIILANKDGTMPEYAESIESGAFQNIAEHAVVTLPKGLTFVSKAALDDCKFAQLNIGEDVVTIDAFAFKDAKIKRIYVTSVPTIVSETFGDMKADVVHLDGAVNCIEANAFHDSTVADIYIGESVKLIKNGAINKVKVDALTIPFLGARNGVAGEEDRSEMPLAEIFGTEGSEFSFTMSTFGPKISDSLVKLTVLSGRVTKNAFSGADNIETMILKDGVTGELAENAFMGVASTFTLYIGSGVTGFGRGCFYRAWWSDTTTINYYGTEQEFNALTKYAGEGKDDWVGKTDMTIRYCVPQP